MAKIKRFESAPKYALEGKGNGPLRRYIDNAVAFLDRVDAAAERRMQVQEFREIRLGMLMTSGISEFSALEMVRTEEHLDREVFEGKAVDLFAYRRRLTASGQGGGDVPISPETFQHSLNTNPQAVLENAEIWASTFYAREAATADFAHTVSVNVPAASSNLGTV
ncbi:MAG: hypothetical protein JWO47_163 [Candidatus Saccharibacteria bacterium]|nr:hypothetical protein [Candidatus Saccharibacteria bacterium]